MNGTFYFLTPVNGKVTGAVFLGEGHFVLEPASPSEKRLAMILTKSPHIEETFDVAVLRFTDGAYDEIKKAGVGANSGDTGRAAGALKDNLDNLANDRLSRYNLNARILQDLLASGPGGLFYAFLHGRNIDAHEVFAVDPQGVAMFELEPEEVAFAVTGEGKYGVWYSGHFTSEYANGAASGTQHNAATDIQKQIIDMTVERSGRMQGKVTTTVAAVRPGIRVLPFKLFRNFEVESVTDANGVPLPFIKEHVSFNSNESDDAGNFNVIVPKPLAAGETVTFTTAYAGKEAITNEGGGNYYPVAREDWYPSTPRGDYADYDITLHVPKGMKVAATGALVKDSTQDKEYVSQWRSEAPIGVAGFTFGKFRVAEQKMKDGTLVQSYANESQPDWVSGLLHQVDSSLPTQGSHVSEVAVGNMNTTGMMKQPLSEAQAAIQIYSDYFGALPYKRVSLTQQVACNYGQAWPELVWLPICAFFDSQVRHTLGVDDVGKPYWTVVTPHEVAHQWWGHTVGWESYRDQWMSEGFAELSASLFTQAVYKPDQFLRFWRTEREGLLKKNRYGFRPFDVGTVTTGFRLSSARAGSNTELIYAKGGYILHMLRMMMWDVKTGDEKFKAMMRDFVKTNYNRPASTEDFKAAVERHMTPDMDLEGNHKMDWFFNEWVYGMELPKYDFTGNVLNTDQGVVLDLKLTQSDVGPNFRMPVPVYVELANGSIRRLGAITMVGSSTFAQQVKIGKMPEAPKKVWINYYYDVLSGD